MEKNTQFEINKFLIQNCFRIFVLLDFFIYIYKVVWVYGRKYK